MEIQPDSKRGECDRCQKLSLGIDGQSSRLRKSSQTLLCNPRYFKLVAQRVYPTGAREFFRKFPDNNAKL